MKTTLFPLLGLILLCCVNTPCRAEVPISVQENSGEVFSAKLLDIRENTITVQPADDSGEFSDSPREIPLDALTLMVFNPPEAGEKAAPPILVSCTDGSRFAVSAMTLAEGKYHLESAPGGAFSLNAAEIHFILLKNDLLEASETKKADAEILKVWEESLALESRDDILVVDRDGKLSWYRGTIHAATDEAVRFEMGGDTLNIRRDRVFGLIPAAKPGAVKPEVADGQPAWILTDTDGNRWKIKSLRMTEKTKFTWETPAGTSFSAPAEKLAQVDFSEGKMVYLSSLKPESVKWTPYISLPGLSSARDAYFTPKMDRSVSGGPLKIQNRVFLRGIGMTSRTEMTFRLPDQFSRLQAVIGINDSVRPKGDATVIILGDTTELFRSDLDGKTPATEIDLDIRGVRRVTLIVDYGNDMDISDHVDFGDIKLMK